VVACAASIVSAQVYSANVVGYSKVSTPEAGSVEIVALTQFGGSDTVGIQDAIANLAELNASATKDNADKLYVWNGSGYDTFGLYYKSSTDETFWMSTGSIGWVLAIQATPAADVIARGAGVWYQTGTGGVASEALVAGEVPNDGTYDVTLASSFDIVSFPYSSSVNLADLEISNATASSSKDAADKLYVWNGSGYDTYGLYLKASTGDTYWMSTASIGWVLAIQAKAATAVIDLGQGFWYESVDGAKTISFSQNYSL
jgi:hypothetical protein